MKSSFIGSLSVLSKDCIKNLKFIKPFTQKNTKGRTVFFSGVYKPGLIIIRRLEDGVILFSRKNKMSMYETAKQAYKFWQLKYGIHLEFAFISLPLETIDQGFIELRQLLRNTPHHNQFDLVWPLVLKGEKITPHMLRFENIKQRAYRTITGVFPKYRYSTGVYVIWQVTPEVSACAYVGQSLFGLGKRMHSHFLKKKKDRPGSHYRVCFAETKNKFDYFVSVIEIPVLQYNSRTEILEVANKIEQALIKMFIPIFNKMHKKEEQPDYHSIPYIPSDPNDYF